MTQSTRRSTRQSPTAIDAGRVRSADIPLLLSATRLARALGVSRSTVYVWDDAGELFPPRGKIGTRRAWLREDLEKWLDWKQPSRARFLELSGEAAAGRRQRRRRGAA